LSECLEVSAGLSVSLPNFRFQFISFSRICKKDTSTLISNKRYMLRITTGSCEGTLPWWEVIESNSHRFTGIFSQERELLLCKLVYISNNLIIF